MIRRSGWQHNSPCFTPTNTAIIIIVMNASTLFPRVIHSTCLLLYEASVSCHTFTPAIMIMSSSNENVSFSAADTADEKDGEEDLDLVERIIRV